MANLQFARRRRFPSPLQSVDSSVGPVKPSDSDITSDDLNVDDGIEDTSRFYDKENENPDVQKLRDLTINAPHLEDYLPGTGRKIGNSIAAALTAFGSKSPALGIKLGDELNEKGVSRAKDQFTQDLGAANDVTKASQTSASLAQRDEARQQDTESTNANLEERAKEHADILGLDYSKLTEEQKQHLAQQANWADERKRDQQRLVIDAGRLANEQRGTDIREKEFERGGKPQTKLVTDTDPNSPTYGTKIYKSITPGTDSGETGPLSAQEQMLFSATKAVMNNTDRIKTLLSDPEVQQYLGPVHGRVSLIKAKAGTDLPDKVVQLQKAVNMVDDAHARIFQARGGVGAFQHFEDSMAGTYQNPKMLGSVIDSMREQALDTAESILPGARKGLSAQHGGGGQPGQNFQIMKSKSTGQRFKVYKDGRKEPIQ